MDYSKKVYSFLKLKGRIWESEYAHFSIGLKAFEKIRKENAFVLDVGCGAGSLTALWQDKLPGLTFEGVDISPTAIQLAKKLHPNITFRISPAENLKKNKKGYTGVSICEVIEHVRNPEKVLINIYKLLNKNGILYLTTQIEADEATLVGKIYKNEKPKERIAGHIQVFNRKSIVKMIKSTGFKVLAIYYNCHFLGQIEDYIYLRYLRSKNAEVLSFTNYLQKKSKTIWRLGLLLMRIIALIRNIETVLFRRSVGLGIQIIAVKK